MTTVDNQLANEIREVFGDRVEIVDDGFDADIAHLESLSAAVLEHLEPPRNCPSGPTVEQMLLDDLSTDAREAISGIGWTFAEAWASA